MDELEENKRVQLIMMGVMMPLFFAHTIMGGHSFFSADKFKCRMLYEGEVMYIILFMFAISMCFVFLLLLTCVILPTYISKICPSRNRGADNIQERLDALRNEDEYDFNEAFLDGEDLSNMTNRQRR